MSWIKVESSVARNKKFVKAGPAPSWLWLCSLAYSQEGLTDGFIPSEALPYLGVKNPAQLAVHLVKAGLWDVAEGGWQIHDYLEHNRSASDVADLKAKRGNGGKLGGRPAKNLPVNLPVNLPGKPSETIRETFPVAVVDGAAGAVVVDDGKGSGKPPFYADVALRELQAAYPQNRVTFGYKTESAFIQALNGEDSCAVAFATMRANLENHIQSHEWRVKGMTPALEKWLAQGLWKRTMDAAPVDTLFNDKTARTMTSGAAFVAGGAHGPR